MGAACAASARRASGVRPRTRMLAVFATDLVAEIAEVRGVNEQGVKS